MGGFWGFIRCQTLSKRIEIIESCIWTMLTEHKDESVPKIERNLKIRLTYCKEHR